MTLMWPRSVQPNETFASLLKTESRHTTAFQNVFSHVFLTIVVMLCAEISLLNARSYTSFEGCHIALRMQRYVTAQDHRIICKTADTWVGCQNQYSASSSCLPTDAVRKLGELILPAKVLEMATGTVLSLHF